MNNTFYVKSCKYLQCMKQWYPWHSGTLLPSSKYHAGSSSRSSNVCWSVVGGVYNCFNMKIPHSGTQSLRNHHPGWTVLMVSNFVVALHKQASVRLLFCEDVLKYKTIFRSVCESVILCILFPSFLYLSSFYWKWWCIVLLLFQIIKF